MNMKILLFTILLFSASALHAQGTVKSYSIQVSFIKTIHIIFPGAIKYVDLGSDVIIAAKAPGAENVLRVKAARENFSEQTNMTVICEDGTFYSFDVKYSKEPTKLNIILSESIYSKEYGGVSSKQVEKILQAIYKENRNEIKYLGSKMFSIQFLIRGIYIHEGLFFIHVLIKNCTNIPLDIDIIRFRVEDKKVVKRTAIQAMYIESFSSYNEVKKIAARSVARIVYVLPKFTMEDEKQFTIELYEKDGARNQIIRIENQDLENAKTIEKLKIK